MFMSGEQLTNEITASYKKSKKNEVKNKVDINILLNKVRTAEKKEKFESIIFISLISFVIVITGIIVSF